ncbi:hypothetical protein FGO68_gene60 [Halteria grandinella]|uniref:Uncharacterized protein n=1 Tax=Halteria grandinella TaxID=5974 RepID=A0A8J8NA30_HALGN|nr:hypothetical protein FGO68_gene60 [Halteria grandinella]
MLKAFEIAVNGEDVKVNPPAFKVLVLGVPVDNQTCIVSDWHVEELPQMIAQVIPLYLSMKGFPVVFCMRSPFETMKSPLFRLQTPSIAQSPYTSGKQLIQEYELSLKSTFTTHILAFLPPKLPYTREQKTSLD